MHARLASPCWLGIAGGVALASAGGSISTSSLFLSVQVCDDQFGEVDARVACRQLGYLTGEEVGSKSRDKKTWFLF